MNAGQGHRREEEEEEEEEEEAWLHEISDPRSTVSRRNETA